MPNVTLFDKETNARKQSPYKNDSKIGIHSNNFKVHSIKQEGRNTYVLLSDISSDAAIDTDIKDIFSGKNMTYSYDNKNVITRTIDSAGSNFSAQVAKRHRSQSLSK